MNKNSGRATKLIKFKKAILLETGDVRLPAIMAVPGSTFLATFTEEGKNVIKAHTRNNTFTLPKNAISILTPTDSPFQWDPAILEATHDTTDIDQSMEALLVLEEAFFYWYTSIDLQVRKPKVSADHVILFKVCQTLGSCLSEILLELYPEPKDVNIYFNLFRSCRMLAEWASKQPQFSSLSQFENSEFVIEAYYGEREMKAVGLIDLEYDPLDKIVDLIKGMKGNYGARVAHLAAVAEQLRQRGSEENLAKALKVVDLAEEYYYSKVEGRSDDSKSTREELLECRLLLMEGKTVSVTIEAENERDLRLVLSLLKEQELLDNSVVSKTDLKRGARSREIVQITVALKSYKLL